MKHKITKLVLAFSVCLFLMLSVMATFAKTSKAKGHFFKRTITKSAIVSNKLAEIVTDQKWYYFTPNAVADYKQYIASSENETASTEYVEVVKDDYRFYFKPNTDGYEFIYAQKDANIDLYDGFEYDEMIKILINEEVFVFTMQNGRPVCIESSQE